jgi:NADPH:quinone reductase-like Zn-dependent oxidoreductase
MLRYKLDPSYTLWFHNHRRAAPSIAAGHYDVVLNRWASMLASLVVLLALSADANSATPSASLPLTTRKVVFEKFDHGYRWKLTVGPLPAVGAHDVLIHVRAVALNRGDLEILESRKGRDISGLVVASDASGDVLAVGEAVSGIRPGMRVTSTYFKGWVDGPPSKEQLEADRGATVEGVLGDYIVLDDTGVVPAPKGLSYEEAATLPTAGLAAWSATIGQHAHRGQIVIIEGTGGVSTFALQFAAAAGAHVLLTSSSDDKLKRAQAIAPIDGINYREVPEWSKRVLDLTHGHGADLVVDVGGKSTLGQSTRSLAYLGTLCVVGGLTGFDGEIPAGRLLVRVARAQGIFVGSRADFVRMNAFIAAHHLHPVIDRTFALEEYEDALKYMEAGEFVGKIVLRLQAAGS